MRRRRLAFGAAALVLVLLLGGVWLVPAMLDWNRYRGAIASLASQELGRPVHIGGAITLHLLPQPILTAADVAVADAGDGIKLHARALRLRVALGPLLGGRVDARELTLQGADLRLPWPLPSGTLGQRPRAWLTGLQAQVEDSRLQVGDLVLDGIDATLATDPDTGTLSAAGVAQLSVGPPRPADPKQAPRIWQFTVRLARPGRDGVAGLDVSLDGQGRLQDTGGTFSGQLGANGALSGRVAGRGPDLSQLMPAPAVKWRGDGRLSAAGGLAVADELALEIGGAPARGAVALRVSPQARLDLAIAAGRLDLDAWLPALLGRNPADPRPDLRPSLPTGIDLSAEAATLAGGTVRRLRGAFDIGPGTVLLRDVEAVLPGEAQLALSGQMAGGAAPKFDGAVRIKAPDLRATLAWLQRMLPAGLVALPDGVLRTAAVSAHLAGGAGQAALTDLRGTLDGSALEGSVSIRLGTKPHERPGLGARLTLERLALDPWVPNPAALLQRASGPALLHALLGVDSDLRLQVSHADWGAVPLGAVTVELQTEASRVFLRKLEAQPLGMQVAISGQVDQAGRLADGKLDASAPDLTVLRPLLGELPYGLGALLHGPGTLSAQAAGLPGQLDARAVAEFSDLRIEAQPRVNLEAGTLSGPLTLHHPGAPRLLQSLGLGSTAGWLGEGSLSFVGQVAAGPGRVAVQQARLSAGSLRVAGQLTFARHLLSGALDAESLPLPLPALRSPDPLPLAWLQGWDGAVAVKAGQVLLGLVPALRDASAAVGLENGVLTVAHLTAKAAGGTVSGGLTIDAAQDPPRVSLVGQGLGLGVTTGVFGTPIDVLAGQASVTLDLRAQGYSPAALVSTLGGTAMVRLGDGVAGGFDLAAARAAFATTDPRGLAADARSALLSGNTPFATIELPLTLARGAAVPEGMLTSPAGRAALTGSIDLLSNTVDLRLQLQPAIEGAPTLGLRITGPATQPVRTPELAGLARWIAERPPAPVAAPIAAPVAAPLGAPAVR